MEELLRKYPSPSSDEKFTEYWNTFLPDISDRENLKKSHLIQLRILCMQIVEMDELSEFLMLNGRTYESFGRNGLQIRSRPEIQLLKTCVAEIRNYCKMLGLVLVKDTKMTNEDEEVNEFA